MITIKEHIFNYLNFCRDIKKLSPASRRAYSFDMMQFFGFLTEHYCEVTEIEQVSRPVVQAYIQKINRCFAPSSAKRKIACLKGFFHYLEDMDAIVANPFDKLRYKVKGGSHIPDVMTLEELKKVLEAAYAKPAKEYCNSPVAPPEFIQLRDIAVLETLFATGLRVQELCDLLTDDFLKGQGAVKILGKGEKERFVYMESEAVLGAVGEYMAMREKILLNSPYLFVNKFGEKLSSQAVRNMVTKYTREAGVDKKITPHTFRHTFASLLLEEGVDIRYIQEFLGHSSISTTQIYLHVSQKSARNILKSLHPRQKLAQIGEPPKDAVRVNNETG